jgi:murein DD-endopeptidase MepM/ murein hydrolase activator NlpD
MENGKFVDGQYCYSLQMFASECFMRYDKRLINIKFMDETFEVLMELWNDVKEFCQELVNFIFKSLHLSFLKFEARKGVMVTALYRKRGKLSRTLTHSGMVVIAIVGAMMAPIIAQEFPGKNINPWNIKVAPTVLSASTDNPAIDTQISSKVRDSIIDYQVQDGDTVASIANKFGVSADTIRWENDLSGDKIKIGQTLKILPVTGVVHTVSNGDTVYSIAKKYDADPQAIVDFPFNTFTDDETFELAIGQTVIVPDGVMPAVAATPRIRQMTPNAGTVTASGQFVWPTHGVLTQYFSWYHPGLDIADSSGTPDVAADSGTVVYAGWDSTGYGNMVLIDHGNGFKTRYGHLSQILVISGQTVQRGQLIGKMGSTGHSTGPHTHFEIILNGVHVNPLSYLK